MHAEHTDIFGGSKAIGEAFDFQLWPREVARQAQPRPGNPCAETSRSEQ
jgi:hypothetical protein